MRTKNRKIKLEDVPLEELVAIAKNRIKDKIQAKGILVLLQKDQTIDVIKGDWELLQNCFNQLIDNAVKFAEHNEVVIIKVFPENQSTVCEFIDNGSGFIPGILDNPYRFFGIGDRHVDQNTGLNLALVKLIMDAHHGSIEVRNNQTKGATVKLTFNNQQ